jgi:hypothetical protein
MATSPFTRVVRRRSPLAVAAAIAATGIVTVTGGYLIGNASSEDLGSVRSEAAAKGASQGQAMGHKRGYDSGFKAGRRDAYDSAYQRAFDAQLKKAALIP